VPSRLQAPREFSTPPKAVVRILISGAGIAGPTLAYWLAEYGFEPTIVEAAPHLRSGGYLVDF
jgi:2-polyprenyl-6-methoxyphenol hydroxylase-like FAD-dependent oxidoreductase